MKKPSLLFLFLSLVACQTIPDEVVGRTSLNTPSWVLEPQKIDNSQFIYSTYRLQNGYEQTLATKQAQAQARVNADDMMKKRVLGHVQKMAQEMKISPMYIKNVEYILSSFEGDLQNTEIDIDDVYVEEKKLTSSDQAKRTFDVYVLVKMPQEAFYRQIRTLSQRLYETSDEVQKQLAKNILTSTGQNEEILQEPLDNPPENPSINNGEENPATLEDDEPTDSLEVPLNEANEDAENE